MRNRTQLLVVFLASLTAACASDDEPSEKSSSAALRCIAPNAAAEAKLAAAALPLAPESARVDRTEPSFSNPTEVHNPLFPISDLPSAVLLGQVDGKPFRSETTLLSETVTIDCYGVTVEALESMYVAFLDGRIEEVALDWYAADDNGSVWYMGEDVFNYLNGKLLNTDGTWKAGRDGPAAMIMPADPQVGNVYRVENIFGTVFEEVTVKSVNQTVDGPSGPVNGAMIAEELHEDGLTEAKTFAPGYGEFFTGDQVDVEALALGIPADALSGSPPADDLVTLTTGAGSVEDAVVATDWNTASATVDAMTTAWASYRTGGVPPLLETQMNDALTALAQAVTARNALDARMQAVQVARASLDFELRHRPHTEIDIARFDLWALQVLIDADNGVAGDTGAAGDVMGDVTSLEWVLRRFVHTLDSATSSRLQPILADLRTAADASDLTAARASAAELRTALAGL